MRNLGCQTVWSKKIQKIQKIVISASSANSFVEKEEFAGRISGAPG